ncbi:MAG: hypothetical protein NXI10_05565 [bacterium]|nr:hypothetical protein [bacterium]
MPLYRIEYRETLMKNKQKKTYYEECETNGIQNLGFVVGNYQVSIKYQKKTELDKSMNVE